mmetsp:Transcript_17731/g.45834  ORF Transcript_17731/g.45834 Transcript_17731/m.45834 type:complete len:261 (+) Transcript_17731:250-1032(+)
MRSPFRVLSARLRRALGNDGDAGIPKLVGRLLGCLDLEGGVEAVRAEPVVCEVDNIAGAERAMRDGQMARVARVGIIIHVKRGTLPAATGGIFAVAPVGKLAPHELADFIRYAPITKAVATSEFALVLSLRLGLGYLGGTRCLRGAEEMRTVVLPRVQDLRNEIAHGHVVVHVHTQPGTVFNQAMSEIRLLALDVQLLLGTRVLELLLAHALGHLRGARTGFRHTYHEHARHIRAIALGLRPISGSVGIFFALAQRHLCG